MSITLNDSDFQCLQDQLVDLKNKNYELAEKYRRSQADFEAAKAKVCSLQLKLEEQERDFQVTSTTLRREIESVTGEINNKQNNNKEDDYKGKYKKLLCKAKELQQRYEKSVEVVQQLDQQNKDLNEKVQKLAEENAKLREEQEANSSAHKSEDELQEQYKKSLDMVQQLEMENRKLQEQIDQLEGEKVKVKEETEAHLESLNEERKIQERKGLQIVKELKRQLALEKNRTEKLRQRMENLLKEQPIVNTSTNNTSDPDGNSVNSWSFLPMETTKSDINLSSCSRENSEDREIVQKQCDIEGSEAAESLIRETNLSATTSNSDHSPILHQDEKLSNNKLNNTFSTTSSYQTPPSTVLGKDGMLIEEQAALVDRVIKLQHDKWVLEEKLSYMEQVNSSLSEDLANKTDIIKHYFMDQARKQVNTTRHLQSSKMPSRP